MQLKSAQPYDWLEAHVQSQPNEILIYTESTAGDELAISYKKFHQAVQSLAAQVVKFPHQTILSVCSNNPLDYLVTMMTAFKLQMIYLPFSINFKKTTPESIIEHFELAKNYLNRPGFILTSNKNFLPNILTPFKLYIDPVQSNIPSITTPTFDSKNSAYICSSSGTSGKAKLILSNYEGLHLRVKEHAEQVLNGTGKQTLLGFSAPDFDASVMDFLMVLYKGMSLSVVPAHVKLNVFNELPNFFKKNANAGHPITSGVLLPSILCGVKKKGLDPNDFPGLNTLVTMGDTCKIEWLQPWLEKGTTIYYGYGCTETAIAATIAKINRNATCLPLGTPLEGAILYLFDIENDRVVAVIDKNTTAQQLLDYSKQLGSQHFELVQGGIGVGYYLHRDDQNAFLTRSDQSWPFKGSERVYRSGDLVSLENGQLFFQEQFKMFKRNGMRYYLNDIEATFKKIAGIEYLAVKVVEKFIALVVKLPEGISSAERDTIITNLQQLQASVELQLKPDFFLEVDHVNLTDRFKFTIDIKNLQQFKLLHKHSTKPCTTPLEKKLAELYASLLLPNIPGISELIQADDGFINLGGDSIKTSMLTTLIWQEIMGKNPKEGIPFDFANYIYQFNQLSDIATFITAYQHNARVEYHNANSYFPGFYLSNLSTPSKLLLDSRIEPQIFRLIPKQFTEQPPLSTKVISESWESMLEQCMRAIYNFQQVGPYLIITNRSDLLFAQQIAAQLAQTDTRIELLCIQDNEVNDSFLQTSLGQWLKKKSVTVCGKINLSFIETKELASILNSHYQNITSAIFHYKLNKYYQRVETLLSQSEGTATTKANLTDFLYNFCHSDNKTLFLSGTPGTGKKANCLQIFDVLKQGYEQNPSNILPLIVSAKQSSELNILKLLKQFGFNDFDLQLLQSKKIVLIVLDYNHVKRHDFPNYQNFLGWQSLKMIISTRHDVTDSLLAATWQHTPYQRIDLQSADSKQNLDEPVNQQFLIQWLHQELQFKKQIEFDIHDFFDYITKLPPITLKPQPSLWDPNCTIEHRSNKAAINHRYFALIRGLFTKDQEQQDVFHCPTWLKSLAVSNHKEQSNVASFTPFEIALQRHDNSLTKLLKPEELQHIIASEPFFVPLNTGQQQAPLFFFHPLTGMTPVEYRILARSLGPTQAVYNFVMSDNETSSIEFHVRCEFFAKIINKIQPQGPIQLAGWSYGGLTALGVASVLENTRTIGLLLNIDCSSPLGIREIPAGNRAIDLITVLPMLYGIRSELNMEKECKDLELRGEKDLPTSERNKLIDTIFGCARNFYENDNSLNNTKKRLMLQGLINCALNFKAAYDCMTNPPKLNKTKLDIIECGYTKGINEPSLLAGSLWQSFVASDQQIQIHKFHAANHFDICRRADFITLFQKLVAKQQTLTQPITIKKRLKQYLKNFTVTSLYVQQDARENELSSKRYHLVTTKLPEFIQQKAKFLLVSGDSGSGKTTLLHYLMTEQTRIDTMQDKICIYVKVDEDPTNSIDQTLKANSFTEIEINNTLKQKQIIFLLDGVEQVSHKTKLQTLTKEWPNARFIVTCRKEKYNIIKMLLDGQPDGILECELCQFSKENTQNLIIKYEEQYKTGINFGVKFSQYPDTKKLLTNPLILTMLLHILRQVGSFELHNLTRTKIFQTYHHLNYQRVLKSLQITCGLPPGTNFANACRNFAENLAVDIFAPNTASSQRFNKYLEEDVDTQLVREVIPISKHQNKIHFSHDSHGEYYMARRLFNDLENERFELWQKFLFSKMTSIVLFIADMLNSVPERKRSKLAERLFAKILVSRPPATEFDINNAANAITVLNYARVSFSGRDFSFTQLNHADLSNSCNHETNYYKASLVNVDVRNAWFKTANLEGVRWENNTFGIQPEYFTLGRLKNIYISPKKSYLVFVDENLGIIIRDYKTNKFIEKFTEVEAPIISLSFSPDETIIIFSDENKNYYYWSFAANDFFTSKYEIEPHVGFAPDGSHYIVACNQVFIMREAKTRKVIAGFEEPTRFFWHLPSADTLLVATPLLDLKLIDLKNPANNINNVIGHFSSEVRAIVFKNQITFLAHTDSNNKISLDIIMPKRFRGAATDSLNYVSPMVSTLLNFIKTEDINALDHLHAIQLESTTRISEFIEGSANLEQTINEHNCRRYTLSDRNITNITHLAFHPDADLLFSAHDNNVICVWEIKSKRVIHTLKVEHIITTLIVHEQGGLLAAGTKDGYVYLWNTENWDLISKIYAHADEIIKLEFAGERLISLDKMSCARFWLISELKSMHSIGHTISVTTVKQSSDKENITSLSADGMLCRWHITTGQLVSRHQLSAAKCYALSEFSNYVAMIKNNSIQLLDVKRLKIIGDLPLTSEVESLQFDPSEKYIFLGLKNSSLQQITIANLQIKTITLLNQTPLVDLQFARQNSLVARCMSGNLYHYSMDGLNTNIDLTKYHNVSVISARPDCHRLAFAVQTKLLVFDFTSNTIVYEKQMTLPIIKMTLSKDGLFLTVHTKQRIDVFNTVKDERVHHCREEKMADYCWSDDENDLAIIGFNRMVSWHRNRFRPFNGVKHHYMNYKKIIQYQNYFLLLGNEGEIEAWRIKMNAGSAEWFLEWQTHSSPFSCNAAAIRDGQYSDPTTKTILFHTGADTFVSHTKMMQLFKNPTINDEQHLMSLPADHFKISDGNLSALHIAAARGFQTLVRVLLRRGWPINQLDDDDFTPLHHATYAGDSSMAELLFAEGALLQASSSNGGAFSCALYNHRTPIINLALNQLEIVTSLLRNDPYQLESAIFGDHADMVELALSFGADPYSIGDFGTALHLGAITGNPDIVSAILRYQHDLERIQDPDKIKAVHYRKLMQQNPLNSCTALHYAVHNQHLEVVILLLAAGANVNALTKRDWTALHFAARKGNCAIAVVLLQAGALTLNQNHKNETPLITAIENNHQDMACLLIDSQPQISKKDSSQLLLPCIQKKMKNATLKLLQKGADPNHNIGLGLTPLRVAAESDDLDFVKMLLEFNGNPNAESFRGSPFQYVIAQGDLLAFREMLHRGGNIHLRSGDPKGLTTLMHAAFHRRAVMVQTLLEMGLDPNIVDHFGSIALTYAVEGGSPECVRLLAPLTNDINRLDNDSTLLLRAALRSHFEIVTILMENGADPIRTTKLHIPNQTVVTHLLGSRNEATVIHVLETCLNRKKYTAAENTELFRQLITIDEKDHLGLLKFTITSKYHKVLSYLLHKISTPTFDLNLLLMCAVVVNNVDAISILIKAGANVDFLHNQETPILLAIELGRFEAVTALIRHGASLIICNTTALHYSYAHNKLKIFQMLLQTTNIDINIKVNSLTLLAMAIKNGDLVTMNDLLTRGADATYCDDHNNNLLHLAVHANNRENIIEIIGLLTSLGVDMDHRNDKGNTFFHCVVANGHTDIIELFPSLITDNPTTNTCGTSVSALTQLIATLKPAAFELINPEPFQDLPPLHLAACVGDFEATEILLAADAQIISSQKFKLSPLQLALKYNRRKLADFYLNLSTEKEINSCDISGRTALYEAVRIGQLDLVQSLIAKGGDLSIKSNHSSIIHDAAASHNLDLVKFLHGKGHDINVKDSTGDPPLEWACERNKNDLPMIKLLLELGADINFRNNDRRTILHMCVRVKNLAALQFFLTKGVDPRIVDKDGETAIDYALRTQFTDGVNIMLEAASANPISVNIAVTDFFATNNAPSRPRQEDSPAPSPRR